MLDDDIIRAMGPAQLDPGEQNVLRRTIHDCVSAHRDGHFDTIEIPGRSRAGRSYLLELHFHHGRLGGFDVEHASNAERSEDG